VAEVSSFYYCKDTNKNVLKQDFGEKIWKQKRNQRDIHN
jgi:hypothetical protein